MKKVLSLLCVFIVLVGMAGCGSAGIASLTDTSSTAAATGTVTSSATSVSKNSKPVKLTYWHFDGSSNIVSAYEEMNKMFTEKYPNITVDFLGLPADSFFQKYLTAIATNTAPDLFGTRTTELSTLINQDALAPLDEYAASWDEYDNIEPIAIEVVKDCSGDGKLYMLPAYTNVPCVWYNSKVFAEKNISYPTTIDAYLELCQKYADPAKGEYFTTFRGGAAAYSNALPFILTYGNTVGIYDENGKCIINNPGVLEGLKKYIGIYRNGWTTRDSITNAYKEMVAEFGSGTALYLCHNSTSVEEHKKNLGEGNFMAANLPAGPDGFVVSVKIGSNGASVSSASKNKDAAVKLVEYYASHEAMSYFCRTAGKTPVNIAIYNDEWYKSDPYAKVFSQVLSDPKTKWFELPTYLPQWSNFTSKVIDADIQAMCMGELEPDKALAKWEKLLNQYIEEWKANNPS